MEDVLIFKMEVIEYTLTSKKLPQWYYNKMNKDGIEELIKVPKGKAGRKLLYKFAKKTKRKQLTKMKGGRI